MSTLKKKKQAYEIDLEIWIRSVSHSCCVRVERTKSSSIAAERFWIRSMLSRRRMNPSITEIWIRSVSLTLMLCDNREK